MVREEGGMHYLLDLHFSSALRSPPSFSFHEPAGWLKLFPADPAPGLLRHAWIRLSLMARRAEKLHFLLRDLCMPTAAELQLVRLPPALSPLYSLLRPLRLGCKGGSELVRMLFRKLSAGTPPVSVLTARTSQRQSASGLLGDAAEQRTEQAMEKESSFNRPCPLPRRP